MSHDKGSPEDARQATQAVGLTSDQIPVEPKPMPESDSAPVWEDESQPDEVRWEALMVAIENGNHPGLEKIREVVQTFSEESRQRVLQSLKGKICN